MKPSPQDQEGSLDSEERLHLVLQATNAGLYDLNLQTGESKFTPEYATMLGYDPADFRLNFERWTSWLHPEDRDRTLAVLQSCMRRETASYQCQFRMRTRAGDWKWIQSSGKVAAWGPVDQPLRMIGTHTDITERKQAETALRESEQRFRQMFEHNRAVMLLIDPDSGAIRDANQAAAEFYGYSREALCRMVIEQINMLPPEQVKLRRQQAIVEPPGHFIFPHRLADGKIRTVEVYTSRIEVGGCPLLFSIIHDITERAQAESALRETEYFLTKSQKVTQLGSYKFDIVAGVWSCTPVLDEIFGIDDRYPKDVDGWLQLVVPEQREEMRQHLLQHVVTLHNRFERDYRIIRYNDRQERWVRGLGELDFDAQGRPLHMIGTIQDITERKRAEAALRDREARLSSIVRASPIGIGVVVNRVLREVNDAACEISGYSQEELVGKSARILYPSDEEFAAVADIYRQLAERSVGTMETRWRRKDGALLDILLRAAHLDPQNPALGTTFVVLDFTERKRADEALRSSERKLAEIFRASPEFIAVTTLDEGRILEFNETFTKLLGFDRDTIGRTTAEIGLWPATADRDRAINLFKVQGRVRNLEVKWRRRTGELIDVLMSAAPVTVDGQACVVTIASDIGELKRLEEERLEMERRLLHAQRLESLGVLAGGIAHDFNNLLMAILGNLDLALMDLSPVSPARFSIEQSATAARRAADLTRQMLAYSGKARFEVRRLDLSELVENNAHLFRACISKIVGFNVHLDRALPLINVDSGQIQQVIMNLITNASEAVGDQPGAISLSTGVQTCDAACLSRSSVGELPPPGRFVYLEVADTGCGMDPPTQRRLFDPFFSTKSMGRGLGMSAILGIVRAHQGAIFVDSTVGKGTTIRVLFPAGEMPPPNEPQSAVAESLPGPAGEKSAAKGTILVVDDEDMVRNVCVHILRRHGWQVIAASNGPEAIELFRQNPAGIDCVILDQSMPQMDGMTVFRELRTIQPGVKVILSSGYSSNHGSGQSLSAEGLAGFIQKPYSLQGLREELARVLQRAG
jgi:two-component system, cell cycle sensor histidine kinase and response regulator CckA